MSYVSIESRTSSVVTKLPDVQPIISIGDCSRREKVYDFTLDAPDFSTFFKQISQLYFSSYENIRLLCRSFRTVVGKMDGGEIDRCIAEISQFRAQVAISDFDDKRSLDLVVQRFQCLNALAHGLFHFLDGDSVMLLKSALNPQAMREIKQKFLNECDQTILLQCALAKTLSFASKILGISFKHSQFFDDGIDLRIPGTFQYLENNIPSEIQEKAIEIEVLKRQFAALTNSPEVPRQFYDRLTQEIIAVPIFDASHPAVQNMQSRAGSLDIAAVPMDSLLRHAVDKNTIERQLRYSTASLPARCVCCFHPVVGEIQRKNLRIDCVLQDEILLFLKRAIQLEASRPIIEDPISTTAATTETTVVLEDVRYLTATLPIPIATQTRTETIPQHQARVARYIYDHILPQSIKDKAAEIAQLRGQFYRLIEGPQEPEEYVDPISREMMSIPVFDASHREQVSTDNSETAVASRRRSRHYLDLDFMERLLAREIPLIRDSNCPICRHPNGRGIRRTDLVIDQAYQEEILQFLRRAVPQGTVAASASA